MQQTLLKYILIALVMTGLLKYTPGLNMDDQKMCSIILITLALVFVMDIMSKKRNEGMGSIAAVVKPTRVNGLCNAPIRYPNPYRFGTLDEDEIASHLRYDNSLPSNPLIQHGQFSEDLRGIPSDSIASNLTMDELQAQICQSKMNDFMNQHNHVRWSPHTHIGKSRGFVDWQRFY